MPHISDEIRSILEESEAKRRAMFELADSTRWLNKMAQEGVRSMKVKSTLATMRPPLDLKMSAFHDLEKQLGVASLPEDVGFVTPLEAMKWPLR